MVRFIIAATFLVALALYGSALACDTAADTVEGSATNAVAYAETAVRWHQIRKVSAAPADDTLVHAKQAKAAALLSAAHTALGKGDYKGALKYAHRVPKILQDK